MACWGIYQYTCPVKPPHNRGTGSLSLLTHWMTIIVTVHALAMTIINPPELKGKTQRKTLKLVSRLKTNLSRYIKPRILHSAPTLKGVCGKHHATKQQSETFIEK